MTDDRPSAATLAAAVAVATVGVLPVFLVGALAVQVGQDLDFDEAGIGLTVAAFFGTGAVTSTPAGRLAERIGPLAAMRLAAGLAALALVAVATLAHSLPALLVCLVGGGLANAVAQPATNLFLARRVSAARLGLAFGVKQSAIPAATLVGGLAVPTVALTVGWRWAFVGAAAAAAALAVTGPGGRTGPIVERGRRRGASDAALRPLVILGIGVGLGAAAAGTLGSFLVSGAVEAGLAEGDAGLLASVCSAAGLTTRLTAGARADRRGGRHLGVVAGMLTAGAVGFLLLATERTVPVVVGGLVAYCLAWGWPGLSNLAVVRSSPGAPGAATGITQTGTYIGALTGPLVFGAVASRWGYPPAWTGAAVTSLAAAFTIRAARHALKADRTRRDSLTAEAQPAPPPI